MSFLIHSSPEYQGENPRPPSADDFRGGRGCCRFHRLCHPRPGRATTNATIAAASAGDTASAAGWSRWKSWTLQPGVGGVEVKGKTRSRKVNGRVQVDIRAQVRDSDLNNSKNACAKGLAYLIPVGSRTGNVCGGKNWKPFQAGGWGIKQVRMRECVDNAWSREKCSNYKTIYPI